MQVILDSSFARPGSAPIWGGKKGEFRDWTRNQRVRFFMSMFFFTVEISVLLEKRANNPLANKVTNMLLDFDDDRRSLMDMVSLISGCILNSTDVVDLFWRVLFFKELSK